MSFTDNSINSVFAFHFRPSLFSCFARCASEQIHKPMANTDKGCYYFCLCDRTCPKLNNPWICVSICWAIALRAIVVSVNRAVTVGAAVCAETGAVDWLLCFADFPTNLSFCQSFVASFRHRPNQFVAVSLNVITAGRSTVLDVL